MLALILFVNGYREMKYTALLTLLLCINDLHAQDRSIDEFIIESKEVLLNGTIALSDNPNIIEEMVETFGQPDTVRPMSMEMSSIQANWEIVYGSSIFYFMELGDDYFDAIDIQDTTFYFTVGGLDVKLGDSKEAILAKYPSHYEWGTEFQERFILDFPFGDAPWDRNLYIIWPLETGVISNLSIWYNAI